MLYVDGLPLNSTRFPDQTTQVWKLPEDLLQKKQINIRWKFHSEAEFMELAQLKKLLDHHGVRASLEILYLPYGRQDKAVSNTTTFALSVFADLLNILSFPAITILDPHSVEALRLIRNSTAVYPRAIVERIMKQTGSDLVCYPDKGALTKYSNLIYFYPHVYGEKVRDQLTGHITSYQLEGDVEGKKVLIIDDICDGGMTFLLLAKDLLQAGAAEVNLFVTHGLFTKGVKDLKDAGIKRILCVDGEAFHDSRGNHNKVSFGEI